MERVNITIGPLSFDNADYDPDNDVLYLLSPHVQARPARFELATSRSGGERSIH
jgi:hypothetical protein